MPKIPSMTVAEAEAAIGQPRGSARVTSANRGGFRKWLTARGIPSLATGGLSVTELQLAYNDTSDEQFNRVLGKLRRAAEEDGIKLEDVQDAPEASQDAPRLPLDVPAIPAGDDKTAQALAILRGLMGPQGVDEAAVSKIVDARIAQALADVPTARLDAA